MTPRVCWVVGAGPAGMYATQAILRSLEDVHVVLADRRRVPFGLGRFGIAPDHPKMRRVVTPLERIVEDDRVTFIGGVEVSAARLAELAPGFDAVVIASGAGADHPTDLGDTLASREVFGWYNADHGVDTARVEEALGADREVVVVGGGNVSIDIVRLLAVGEDRLRATDLPERVVDVLVARPRRPVHLVVRSAASELKFSAPMITELVHELGLRVRVRRHESYWGGSSDSPSDERRSSLELAVSGDDLDVDVVIHLGAQAARAADGAIEISSTVDGGSLVRLAEATVITAIGYGPGALMTDLRAAPSWPENAYVCGWAGNGAKGVLGTNKADALRIVEQIREGLAPGDSRRLDPAAAVAAVRSLADDPVGIEEWRATVDAEILEATRTGRGVERIRLQPGADGLQFGTERKESLPWPT
ncbi:MAG: hypothetical protein J0G30_01595 [Actinomycetales bacterium]|nr:hypothetical protein [Actinomycetales bacterium]